jgi:hypothetical protein
VIEKGTLKVLGGEDLIRDTVIVTGSVGDRQALLGRPAGAIGLLQRGDPPGGRPTGYS